MTGYDLVRVLREAADQHEALIIRNRKLDEEIERLKREYQADVNKIKATTAPQRPPAVPLPALAPKRSFLDNMPIRAIPGYTAWVHRALSFNKVMYVGDMKNLTMRKLRRTPRCGVATIEDVKTLARHVGYPLAD
jgi:hypothetical protein